MITFMNLIPCSSFFIRSARIAYGCDDCRANMENTLPISILTISLKSKVKGIADKLGIKQDILLIENINKYEGPDALGNAFFQAKVGIRAGRHFFWDLLSQPFGTFVIAHEISHIKNNDHFTALLITGIVHTVTTISIHILFPYSKHSILSAVVTAVAPMQIGLLAATIAFVIVMRWQEERADKTAMAICTKEEIQEGANWFKSHITKHLEYRNEKELTFFDSLWRKIKFDSIGNYRLDILHPPLTTRVKYMEDYASAL